MNHQLVKNILCQIGEAVCEKVITSLKEQSIEVLSSVHKEAAADTIYQIDKDVEDIIVPLLKANVDKLGGVFLLAEGIAEDTGGLRLPDKKGDISINLIMDPIDGTRGIMYDKRSAFFLAGAAPTGAAPIDLNSKSEQSGKGTLNDIEVAVMVELPTTRSAYSDTLWAIKGVERGRRAKHLDSGKVSPMPLKPSGAQTIYGGFGQISRFFPPGREVLAAIEEEMLLKVFPDVEEGKTIVFEDQYISSGGQMYELLVGHDRFIADLRTLLNKKLVSENKKKGHICHPYDICAKLIAEESGIMLTDAFGKNLNAPFDLHAEVDWIGYANESIRNQLEVPLQAAMRKYGLI